MAKITNYDFNCKLDPVVLWQYNDAEKLKRIVANQQKFMDENIRDFYDGLNSNVFNLATCNEFGLSVWGALLGVPRPTGFTDEQYRMLLRAKVYLLTFDGSARALNEFFHILFPNALVEVKDNLDMTATITFLTELPSEYEILFQSPYLDMFVPRPSGVAYNPDSPTPPTPAGQDWTKVLSFEGQTHDGGKLGGNFDNSVFYAG